MTNEQYERWKDFALRMAKSCFQKNRRPYWYEIVGSVEFFFDCFPESCIETVSSWDQSTDNHYVCDMFSKHEEHLIPGCWSIPWDEDVPGAYQKT